MEMKQPIRPAKSDRELAMKLAKNILLLSIFTGIGPLSLASLIFMVFGLVEA